MNSELTHFKRYGILFIISSPSGVGKSTLIQNLLTQEENLKLSVSVTTRPPRSTEIHGKDYHFVTTDEFKVLQSQQSFIEWAQVYQNFYGTLRENVSNAIECGQDLIFDIDHQGAQALQSHYPDHVVKIYVLPPSVQELERRLQSRGLDDSHIIAQRMQAVGMHVSHCCDYDYVVINHRVDLSVQHMASIIQAERLKRIRLIGVQEFVNKLTCAHDMHFKPSKN